MSTEPRIVEIGGQRALVVVRRPPLPQTLDRLLAEMRIAFRSPVLIRGWRAACSEQDHRMLLLAEGTHTGTDGVRRSLRLLQCQDCESVAVRDVSWDALPGLRHRGPLLRRDRVIGWYSGARRNRRQYG